MSCPRKFPPAPPGYTLPILHPIVVAGIDPVAEAQLLHLDRCVNSGRYLTESDRLSTLRGPQLERIPVLVSDRSFIDDQFTMRIARAQDAGRLMAGASPTSLRSWDALPTQSVSADALYRSFLPQLSRDRLSPYGFGDPYPIWSASNVQYRQIGPNHLEALTVPPLSSESISVSLPAGRFGRPALTVTEGWSLKGVALRFTEVVQRQDIVLFSVLLIAGVLLAGETAWSSVRRRRYEFGVLRAHGWPTFRIAWLVELEMSQLGLAAGAATLIGVGALKLAGLLRVQESYILLALPLSAAIAAMAALFPALSASKGSAVSVIQTPMPVRRSRPPAAPWVLGLRGFRGSRRWDALLGAAAIALGSSVLGAIVLVEVGFNGRLDATVLGTYLGTHVHPYHVAIGILTLLVGGLCAGQVLAFAYLAHRPEFAVLRALGWPRIRIMSVILAQASWVAVAGGSVAALVVGGFGAELHASPAAIGASALAALAAALATTLLAFSGPAIQSWQMSPGKALHV